MATYTFKIKDGDFVVGDDQDQGGGLEVITGSDKFEQDVRSVLNTNRSGIPNAVGRDGNPFELRAIISQSVTRALQAFQGAQRSRQYAQRDKSERFAGIRKLVVQPLARDPRRYHFVLETISEAGLAILVRLKSTL